MPELPEVHTTVEGIKKFTKGKIIKDVWSDFHLKTTHGHKSNVKNKKYFEDLKSRILGTKIINAQRIGKNVVINLSNKDSLVIHMKMTGHFLYGKYKEVGSLNGKSWKAIGNEKLNDPFNQFIHFIIEFEDNTHLAFSDMRKFASVCIVNTTNLGEHSGIKNLGKDALLIKPVEFIEAVRNKNKNSKYLPIKSLLMDQSIIAGIGNIYSDETLFAAGVHPLSDCSKIKDVELKSILSEAKKILKKSIELGGDSMSDYRNILGEKGGFQNCHKAYKQNGKQCQKRGCTGIIERKVIKGRSAHFCPIHQKLYK